MRAELPFTVATIDPHGVVDLRRFKTTAGALVRDALTLAGVPKDASVGIWGHKRPPDWPLHANDRVEIYAPLRVDPKAVRKHKVDSKPRRGWVARAKRIVQTL